MITIAQRIVVFECAAKVAKNDALKKMYSETAIVLKAMDVTYNLLHAKVERACQEGDLRELREYLKTYETFRRAMTKDQASGAE